MDKERMKMLWIRFVFFAFVFFFLCFYSWGGSYHQKLFYSPSALYLSSYSSSPPPSSSSSSSPSALTLASYSSSFSSSTSPPAYASPKSSDPICKLPLSINPWDQSIKKFTERMPSSIACPSHPTLITSQVNSEGILSVKGDKKRTKGYKCYWSTITRAEKEGDNQRIYSNQRIIGIGSTLNMNSEGIQFLFLKCLNSFRRVIYSRTHYFPSFKPSPLPVNPSTLIKGGKLSSPPSLMAPNVFILVIESLSRLNFLRYLPQTKRALEAKEKLRQRSHIFTLKGLTKIADNSFPNMLALLTGRRLYRGENPGVNESYGPYDSLPLVWKQFQDKGYMTALLEDHPQYTLFNYEASGFTKQPVDWYPRPFWLHIYGKETAGEAGSEQSYCYYKTPKLEVLLDQGKRFFDKGLKENRPTFTLLFYIQVTHADFNKAQLVDSHLASFIKSLDLSFTLFALMGDHGNRYGDVLETLVGKIEERMPLFTLLVPDYLLKAYPSLSDNLKRNEDRLTSWLDIHQMLTDIPSSNYSEIQVSGKSGLKRAYSLWREEVPTERTCDSALIPETYCVCHESKEMNTSLDAVREASLAFVDFINEKTDSYSLLCARFSLKRTKYARLVLYSDSLLKSRGVEMVIELVIEATPSEGIFRGQVGRRLEGGKWSLWGELTRINKYLTQSNCISRRWLKPYCYCRKQTEVG